MEGGREEERRGGEGLCYSVVLNVTCCVQSFGNASFGLLHNNAYASGWGGLSGRDGGRGCDCDRVLFRDHGSPLVFLVP